MAAFTFHPGARFEYIEATNYYLNEASPRVAEAFSTAVASAVSSLVANPLRWRVVEPPDMRRYVFTKFPYVLYYRWEPSSERITVYAVMHCSRKPGYWRERLGKGS